jgi:hypothetical protein
MMQGWKSFVKRTEPKLWAEMLGGQTPLDVAGVNKPWMFERTFDWGFPFGLPGTWGWPSIQTMQVKDRVLMVVKNPYDYSWKNRAWVNNTATGSRLTVGRYTYRIAGVAQYTTPEAMRDLIEYNANVYWHHEIMVPGAEGEVDCLWRGKEPRLTIDKIRATYHKSPSF